MNDENEPAFNQIENFDKEEEDKEDDVESETDNESVEEIFAKNNYDVEAVKNYEEYTEMRETFQSTLEKIADDQMIELIQQPERRAQFWRMLYIQWEMDKDITVDNRYFTAIRFTNNYKVLEYHVRRWSPRRKELLDKLSECCKDLNRISKYCILGRIILCLVESFSTIYGLHKKENTCLEAATVFGATGLFCAVVETLVTKQRLLYLNEFVKTEEVLFREILSWISRHPEIKEQMMNVFKLGFYRCLNDDISKIIRGKSLKTYFSEGISILETNRHICDLLKLFLQYLHGDKRYYMYQRITALDRNDRDFLSFPVFGRLFLNALSIVLDAYAWWRNDVPYVCYLSNLEETLRDELDFMMLIIPDKDLE